MSNAAWAPARARRDTILEQFGGVPELEKVPHAIRDDDFEQMSDVPVRIVYLDYENPDETNNDAERENWV